jgi:hypothetical protein
MKSTPLNFFINRSLRRAFPGRPHPSRSPVLMPDNKF